MTAAASHVEVAFENQRWYPFKGWTKEMLPTDRPGWSTEDGEQPRELLTIKPPPGGKWLDHWRIVACYPHITDSEGWQYSKAFWTTFAAKDRYGDCVRRRKWVRPYLPRTEKRPEQPATSPIEGNQLEEAGEKGNVNNNENCTNRDLGGCVEQLTPEVYESTANVEALDEELDTEAARTARQQRAEREAKRAALREMREKVAEKWDAYVGPRKGVLHLLIQECVDIGLKKTALVIGSEQSLYPFVKVRYNNQKRHETEWKEVPPTSANGSGTVAWNSECEITIDDDSVPVRLELWDKGMLKMNDCLIGVANLHLDCRDADVVTQLVNDHGTYTGTSNVLVTGQYTEVGSASISLQPEEHKRQSQTELAELHSSLGKLSVCWTMIFDDVCLNDGELNAEPSLGSYAGSEMQSVTFCGRCGRLAERCCC